MTRPIQNTFTSYSLTEDETRKGQTLTTLNLAVLQNQRAQIAEEKLNLTFTPNDVLSYTQQEAFLAGQLAALSYIIAAHEATQISHP